LHLPYAARPSSVSIPDALRRDPRAVFDVPGRPSMSDILFAGLGLGLIALLALYALVLARA
jgi:hypothetical protein